MRPRPLRRPESSSACRRSALPDVRAIAATIDAGLRAAGSPERAEQEKRYLKSAAEHYGASVPAIRRVTREALRAEQALDHDDTVALVQQLWRSPVHENRMAAVEVLEAQVRLLSAADLPLVEQLVREAKTWALVDGLAASVAGVIAMTDAKAGAVLDGWADDADFWVRRSALLALLPGVRAGSPDLARVARYCDAMLEEKEFFVRKAIGWLLRELGRRDSAWVVEFLQPRAARAAGLTVREAVKWLPEADRARLLAAHAG